MIDVTIMWPIWVLLTAFVLVAWLSLRARRRALYRQPDPIVDDDAVQTILERGVLTTEEDEPTDMDRVRREEESFWNEERWDEAEEY